MAARLQAAGVRPISSIVDITNYVNLEMGQPMHAFDLARLAGPELRARRARAGEMITTLDGVARRLDVDMLVIADRDRAQAVAGGGWDVVAPTFRVDLMREADLIEEVGRHFGFDQLPATFPAVTEPAPPPDVRIPRDQLVRRVATAAGFSEAVTFGFIEAKAAD